VNSRILINRDGGKIFPIGPIEKGLMEAVNLYLSAYQQLQIDPPIIVMVSLIGVRGYYIRAGQFKDARASFDRDTLLLPDLLIEEDPVDVGKLLKPAFDAMWQASGWRRCFNYDKHGQRINSDAFIEPPH
jgi:hypothetical protein